MKLNLGLNIPLVMSFNIEGLAYRAGFRNPSGLFPTLSRSSLIRLMTDANIGVLADVPPERANSPPK